MWLAAGGGNSAGAVCGGSGGTSARVAVEANAPARCGAQEAVEAGVPARCCEARAAASSGASAGFAEAEAVEARAPANEGTTVLAMVEMRVRNHSNRYCQCRVAPVFVQVVVARFLRALACCGCPLLRTCGCARSSRTLGVHARGLKQGLSLLFLRVNNYSS